MAETGVPVSGKDGILGFSPQGNEFTSRSKKGKNRCAGRATTTVDYVNLGCPRLGKSR